MLSRSLGNWSSSKNEITWKCVHKHSVNGEVLKKCWYCDFFFLKIPILWKIHVLWVLNLAREELKESRNPTILPMFQYGRPSAIFHSLGQSLSHTYSTLPVSRHVKDKNYSHWESKTDTTLSVGTHVIMGIGQVITLLQPDTQDPTTPQWPHFLSRGTCGKVSFHYSSKEAKLEIFPKNFFFLWN